MQEYKLHTLIKNGNIMVRIDKGMYGLPQASILANKLLKDQLLPHRYCKCEHTPGLWCHHTCRLMFLLVVDDFGVQYSRLQDAQHLLAALKQLRSHNCGLDRIIILWHIPQVGLHPAHGGSVNAWIC
jgi:hypothetical protein